MKDRSSAQGGAERRNCDAINGPVGPAPKAMQSSQALQSCPLPLSLDVSSDAGWLCAIGQSSMAIIMCGADESNSAGVPTESAGLSAAQTRQGSVHNKHRIRSRLIIFSE